MKRPPQRNRLVAVFISAALLSSMLLFAHRLYAQDGPTYLPMIDGPFIQPTATPVIDGIQWDGGGDGSSWADARNWAGNRLPSREDHAVIPAAPGRTVIITDSVDVAGLHSDAALLLAGGQLVVRERSVVNNRFAVFPESALRVEGAAAHFSVNGATVISGTVWAFDGGQAILPQATLIDGDTDDYAELTAVGEGSVIDLSGVVTILGNSRTDPGGGVHYFLISAIDGAHVDLSSLVAVVSGRILATSTGEGSLLDFDQIVDLGEHSKLEVADRGRIFMPRAANLDTISLDLGAGGQISTTQVLTLARSAVTVIGDALHFPNVQSADASTFDVSEGGSLAFPALTSYTGAGGITIGEWTARDAGSLLSFPNLHTLRGNSFANAALVVSALDGARVELPQLNVIDGGKVQFESLGVDSRISLPSLTRFARSGRGMSALEATEGGRIVSPNLVELTGVAVKVDAETQLDTSQIITLSSGRIEVEGGVADFANLTHLDGTSLLVRNGGVLTLPQVISYTGDGLDFFPTLRVEGEGSLLDLSTVTELAGSTFVNDALRVQAVDGGLLRLPEVAAIGVGMVQFEAEGIASRIDLSSLADFQRGGSGLSWLRAGSASAIDFGDNPLRLKNVEMFVEAGGVYSLTSLLIEEGARLQGGGRLAAPVHNQGEVAPAFAAFSAQGNYGVFGAGTLEINGRYTQTISGTLAIEIAGPLAVDYDRLEVNGPVQLGGKLALQLLGIYDPAPGATFTILTGAPISGVFDEITGAQIDGSRRFEVSYGMESVMLTVQE